MKYFAISEDLTTTGRITKTIKRILDLMRSDV
jgi:hypothetical protein